MAKVLHNLDLRLSALGRPEEALHGTAEAVDIRRPLAAQRPDAFRPDLALSLNNLGNGLSDLGRREEALEATEEAVGLYRQLAAQRPDAFRPDLAMSLGAKGTVLREMGDATGAAASFRQAVECLKPLFLRSPEAFRPLMTNLVRIYVGACEAAGAEPDGDLLGEILPRVADDEREASWVCCSSRRAGGLHLFSADSAGGFKAAFGPETEMFPYCVWLVKTGSAARSPWRTQGDDGPNVASICQTR